MNKRQLFCRFFATVGYLCALTAANGSYAADVFVSPDAAKAVISEQDARIARLEETLKKALEKLDKPVVPADALTTEGAKQSAPAPMPMPFSKSAPGKVMPDAAALAMAPAPDAERVIGVMNDSEIYIRDGVVRKRELPAPAKSAKNSGGNQ